MRSADRLFTENFDRLLPRQRSQTPEKAKSPLGITEDIAYDWLANGGKRFRPFITLAAFDAATGGKIQDGKEAPDSIPDAVGRVAMAIEAFHKASLVHDDIQDNDQYRYGRETLHREHGVGSAINIGDYLIGVGYRLIKSCRDDLGADVAVDILDRMSAAHIKLCDGQGAEMAWQAEPTWDLTPIDALQIYALKTSPAFEAALYAGLRMAGDIELYDEMVSTFSRHVGVGFQILNDLKDWRGDSDNKLVAGQDAIALRPTVLLALALQGASDEQKNELEDILTGEQPDSIRVNRLRMVFESAGVFDKAAALVDKSRARAEALADDVADENVRQLLYFFIDTVLAPEGEVTPEDNPNLVTLQLGQIASS